MKIERQTVGTVDVCVPQDALIEEGAEEFSAVLKEYLERPQPRVIVSMKNVGYMDSAALEALLSATNDLSERSQQLKLACVTPTCREILEMTGLSGRFQFFKDIEAAVRSYL